MKTNIGIPEEHLQAVALELNRVLADEYLLYTTTRNYHAVLMSMSTIVVAFNAKLLERRHG